LLNDKKTKQQIKKQKCDFKCLAIKGKVTFA